MFPTWSTFLLEAANFILLAGVLSWLLFKPIRQSLEARREEVRRQAEEAKQNLEEANEIKAQSKTRRDALEKELEQLRQERTATAEQEAEQILKSAREAAARERGLLEQQLSHAESSQLERLSTAVATATGETVRRLLDQIQGPELESALVRAACRQIEPLKWNGSDPVVVESAQPLSSEARSTIENALQRPGEYRLNDELGSGLRITTPLGVVDASTLGLAKYAQRALQQNLKAGSPEGPHHETGPTEPSA